MKQFNPGCCAIGNGRLVFFTCTGDRKGQPWSDSGASGKDGIAHSRGEQRRSTQSCGAGQGGFQ